MYSEIYPKLYAFYLRRYGAERFNFEVVVTTLLEYFPDLFQFEVLEAEVQKIPLQNGSYWQLFDFFASKLTDLAYPPGDY